jgi:hypothetical protein
MTTRPRWIAAALAALFLLAAAPAARAGLSTWSSLPGLTAANNASWVRVYTTGTPPTTIYAGTEGDGVFESLTDGATWAPFSGGLSGAALNIRTIYVSSGKVYAGTTQGLWSTPASSSGGAWTPVAQGPEPDPAHPTRLNQAVQGVISLTAGPMLAGTVSEGVFRSTDSGQTWSPPADGNGMPEGETVWSFASFANFVWAATSDGIYRSADQGATWSLASDGIPESATTLSVFPDGTIPTIYYAATASDGLYRTIDGGITWQPMNYADFNGGTIHAIQQFAGATQTRLYTATSNGFWVATTPNIKVPGPGGSLQVPGPVVWRHDTEAGLGNNTIMWALTGFRTTPGTLLAGTQSNGGYALTFQPPANSGQAADLPSWLAQPILPLKVGTVLVGTPGTWTGTPQIDYAYQWQQCATSVGSCTDIDGATDSLYTLAPGDLNKYIRVVVTATNDFPSFSLIKASSAIHGTVGAKPGPLPGDTQQSGPSITVTPADDQFLPTEGDTLTASGWLFNPVADNTGFQWFRCDENGDNCNEIAGAKSVSYIPTFDDEGLKLRVEVKGSNANGTATLPISGPTNQIIPLPAKDLTPPTLSGKPFVGATLVGGVGTWQSPRTTYERRWESCEPDGSACSPILNASSAAYIPTAADVGMRLRMHVSADVNSAQQLPYPVDAYTPLTDVVAYRPGTAPPPPPGTTPPPVPEPGVPAVSKPKLSHGKVVFTISGPGSVTLLLQRGVAGHLKKGHCVAGKTKKHKCTKYSTKAKIVRTATKAGQIAIALPKKVHGHKLPRGRYRAVVTPADAAGHTGKAQTLALVLR